MKEQENVLFLTIGKEVKLNFDENDYLSSIRLTVNKVAELFGNKLVNESSIFNVEIIGLITQSNYRTYIRVVDGRQCVRGNAKYKEVAVDQKRTHEKEGNRKVYSQGHFEFFVKKSEKIKKNELILPYNLFR
ncbi:hypothetical protein RV10_GL002366 [Enterococcus pallens]|nr:hypothetical protein RV10_GL002366 [Enterococcus pallens]